MVLILLGILLALAPLPLVVLLRRSVGRAGEVPVSATVVMLVGGAVAGAVASYVESMVFELTGLSLDASQVGAQSAALSMFLLSAPLGQGVKVGVVWPLYHARRFARPALGMFYAVSVGAGFALARAVVALLEARLDVLLLVRLALGVPAHLFFAGVWGFALASGRARGRWFSASWVLATLLHGLYEHIVFGRGPGMLIAAVPLLLGMALVSWVALRDMAPAPDSRAPSSRGTIIPSLPDPPSLNAVRRALSRSDRSLMLHWIAIGTFVTIGVMIVALALAVFVGHHVGIDFAVADEGDVRSTGPLTLLGAAFLAAFPVAGYLVAKASAATSVLEPALGAGLAIAAVVLLVSMASPVAVVFALAAAPVAFALACGGAWFGLAR